LALSYPDLHSQYLAKKALAFNMTIKYHNRHRLPTDEAAKYAATYCTTLHDLLGASDVVSLHLPPNARTANTMDPAALAATRSGEFLVNTHP
jgi:lactate dehydrogenase-like 2-hydroxyacid dehydrogenase